MNMNTIEIKATEAPQGNRTMWIVGDNIANIYQAQVDIDGTFGMYWVDLAPGIADESISFYAADIKDLEKTETAIVPDATVPFPHYHDDVPRLYFSTKENAAQFAYDYQQSRSAGNK